MLKPRRALNKAFLKVKPNRSDIERFKQCLIGLIDGIDEAKREEFHKTLLTDFLKKIHYEGKHFINIKDDVDLVIHTDTKPSSNVSVLIEVKKPTNKAEMPQAASGKLNSKALQELVLYYLRERITHKNLEVKHLIITNIYEWFIFDAQLFDRLFAQNKTLVKQFTDFEGGRLAERKTEFFYHQIAEPFIAGLQSELEFTYFNLSDYEKPLRNSNKADDTALIALFKLLSPEHLLKLPFANDSNSLDKRFYSELLHIIGLTEIKDGGKKLIQRNKAEARHSGSLLENAILQLNSLNKLNRLENPSQYGKNPEERVFNLALELVITWVNRILFLKLLEAQLLSYHKGDKSYAFLNSERITNYDDLNSLFFEVLGQPMEARSAEVKSLFPKVPYLNSSLFDPNEEIEHIGIFISNLRDEKEIPLHSQSVLKDEQGRKRSGSMGTLAYLFAFLDAYDFSSEGAEDIQEDNKTLINASVLGLIFEKINGYKDGSFFTPGFITMYMCRETIRKAVVQKFNETKGWDCADLDALYDKIDDRNEANAIVNSVKICDPAVGSGHFLVSALNEMIAVKNDLNILQDRNGRRLKEYQVEVVNDELIVTDEEGELFEYNPGRKESQRIQETLFHEKQSIIENCLFGVDINPNSVKICRLRLWIELLKSAYYKNAEELETLPNIDINIKVGNSLVSRFAMDADLKQALRKSKWNMEGYRTAVATYRNAENKEQKREMEKLIASIKSDFRSEIAGNDPKLRRLQKLEYEYSLLVAPNMFQESAEVYGNKANQKKAKEREAKMLSEITKLKAEIDEIKANKIYENAFEWRFEFPEVLNDEGDFVGFDVVIGNPPYIRQEELIEVKPYLQSKYRVYAGTADLLVYFFEISLNVLKQDGILCMITSNKFVKSNYGRNLRKFLSDYQINEIIDFGELPVFEEAATFPGVYSISKKDWGYDAKFTQVDSLQFQSLHALIAKEHELLTIESFQGETWRLNSINILHLLNKIKQASMSLGEYISGDIMYGIKTGFNEAFIIDEEKRIELIEADSKSLELIHPFSLGDDIRNYHIRSRNRYLILTKIGVRIDDYPAIFNHLKKYQTELEKRWDKGNHWWELRACAYYEAFEKPKIVYPDIAKESRFAFSATTQYFANTCYFISTENKHLLALLNSKLIWFYYSQIASVLGDANKGGRLRWFSQDVVKLPIAKELDKVSQLEVLANEIIQMKSQSPSADTTTLEAQIDQLVYELYDLTEDEIKIIEGVG